MFVGLRLSLGTELGLGAPMSSYLEGALYKLIYRYRYRMKIRNIIMHSNLPYVYVAWYISPNIEVIQLCFLLRLKSSDIEVQLFVMNIVMNILIIVTK